MTPPAREPSGSSAPRSPAASDQVRGVTLYAMTVVLAAAGGFWFFASAPRTGEDPRTVAGRRALERALPDVSGQTRAETMVMAAGSRVERNTPVRRGSYVIVVACAGAEQLRVRLSTTTVDSGRAVSCSAEPQPVELNVALSSMFFLSVTSEAEAETVFRWRLVRSGSL